MLLFEMLLFLSVRGLQSSWIGCQLPVGALLVLVCSRNAPSSHTLSVRICDESKTISSAFLGTTGSLPCSPRLSTALHMNYLVIGSFDLWVCQGFWTFRISDQTSRSNEICPPRLHLALSPSRLVLPKSVEHREQLEIKSKNTLTHQALNY